jgi:hypothetical protein
MDLTTWVPVSAGQDFSLLHSVQTGSGHSPPPHTPIQWVLGGEGISPGESSRGVNLTTPSSAEAKNVGAILCQFNIYAWYII